MKRLLLFVVSAGILAILPAANGADLTGTWTGAFDFQGQSIPLTFHLSETGVTVTGTIEGLPTTPTDIHDGRMDAGKLSFWANTDYQGQTYKLDFAGQPAADQISITFGTDDGSWSSELTARKSTETVAAPAPTPAQDVTGTWQGSFDYQGSTIPVTIRLVSTNGTVTGTISGMVEGSPDKSTDIHDGRLQGAALTFWVNTDYQGDTYQIDYQGTVANGKIQFDFGTDDGSWSTEMTATKQ